MAKSEQMAKPEQILIIEPSSELSFKGPFTTPVSSYIKLTNPTEHQICYKIKTTAPKRYCVRPNSGILDPSEKVVIAVTLQPFDFDLNDKNKHKFMVQSIKAPDGDDFNVENLWKQARPESLMDSKLRCVFEMPMDKASNFISGLSNAKEDTKKQDVYSQSITSSEPVDPEIQKATNEIARLREELSASQRENLQLKEDIIKARHSQLHAPSTFTNARSNQMAQAEGNQFTAPVIYIAIGVFIGLLAMFLGKAIF